MLGLRTKIGVPSEVSVSEARCHLKRSLFQNVYCIKCVPFHSCVSSSVIQFALLS